MFHNEKDPRKTKAVLPDELSDAALFTDETDYVCIRRCGVYIIYLSRF